jgi:hypothetical protein
VAGAAASFSITATGPPPPSLSEDGSLPNGVTFVGNGNGTANFSGTPTTGSGGTYPLTITASNGVGSPAIQSFTLTVWQGPAIITPSDATFVEGTPSSFRPMATGYPIPIISEYGALPIGVTYTSAGLSGTPTESGTYSITLTAHNGVGTPDGQSFTLQVLPMEITSSSLGLGKVGAEYSTTLKASGGNPPYSWSLATGSKLLPSGLKLSSAGVISGKPTKMGTYSFTIKVVDTKPKTKPITQHTATKVVSIVIS